MSANFKDIYIGFPRARICTPCGDVNYFGQSVRFAIMRIMNGMSKLAYSDFHLEIASRL